MIEDNLNQEVNFTKEDIIHDGFITDEINSEELLKLKLKVK